MLGGRAPPQWIAAELKLPLAHTRPARRSFRLTSRVTSIALICTRGSEIFFLNLRPSAALGDSGNQGIRRSPVPTWLGLKGLPFLDANAQLPSHRQSPSARVERLSG